MGPQPLSQAALTRVLERYFEAIRTRAWEGLADCLARDVRRTGPHRDVVEGRGAYVAFLARVVPGLPNHALEVSRIRWLADGGALVEISEFLDVEGARTEFPEALIFDFDETGRISQLDIYLMQPAR
jgi:hypothetical protein